MSEVTKIKEEIKDIEKLINPCPKKPIEKFCNPINYTK